MDTQSGSCWVPLWNDGGDSFLNYSCPGEPLSSSCCQHGKQWYLGPLFPPVGQSHGCSSSSDPELGDAGEVGIRTANSHIHSNGKMKRLRIPCVDKNVEQLMIWQLFNKIKYIHQENVHDSIIQNDLKLETM